MLHFTNTSTSSKKKLSGVLGLRGEAITQKVAWNTQWMRMNEAGQSKNIITISNYYLIP
jgi:hypothetical protein